MRSPIARTQDFYARYVHQPKFSLWLMLFLSAFFGLLVGLPFGWYFLVIAPTVFVLIFVILSFGMAARSWQLRKFYGMSSRAYSRLPEEKQTLPIFRRAKRELDHQQFRDKEEPGKDERA